MPVFSFVAGLIPETIYYVQVSWVSANGQEGDSERADDLRFAGGELAGGDGGESSRAVATGFNVYMGLSAETVTLQTLDSGSGGRGASRCHRRGW